MRRLSSLLWLDLCSVWLSRIPVLMIVSVLIQGIVLNFAVPEVLKIEPTVRLVDNTQGRLFARAISKDPSLALADKRALATWVAKDRQRVGLVMSGTDRKPHVELLHAGDPDSGAVALGRTTATMFWGRFTDIGWDRGHVITHLGADREEIPFNQLVLALLLVLNLAIGSILFLSTMIFEDKATGALQALRVSPMGSLSYMTSKILATMLTSIPPVFVLVALVKPESLESSALWLMTFAAVLCFSFLGVILGILLKSLLEGIYAIALTVYALTLPLFTYFVPALDQLWLHWVPTWGTLYGVRAALFPTGREDDPALALQSMVPALIIFAGVALMLMRKRVFGRFV